MPTISPCATKLITQAAIMIGPSSGSRMRKLDAGEDARATPPSAATRLPARTTSAIVRNEKTYVHASIDEHGRRARRGDQDAREHRAGELRELVRAAEDRVHLGDRALVLARHLRDDDPRRREVRRGEDADREGGAEERARTRGGPCGGGSGSTSSSGPRAASETSIVRFAPIRAMSEPAGMPKIAIGSISAARTQPIFAVEPVVTRTNHGSATNVIEEPVSETSSAVRSPRRERFLSMAEIIKRPYGFVKCGRCRR